MRLSWKMPPAAALALVLAASTFEARAQQGGLYQFRTPQEPQQSTVRAPARSPAARQALPQQDGGCERQIQAAARMYGIPEGILYSVGLTETGRKGSLSANAMNIEGKAYFPASLSEALQLFAQAKAGGAKLIDIGCMQINHHYHGEEFSSVQEMFDPAKNVQYAALFLKRLHDQHETWTMAVARYHAGPNNNPAQQQYVCRVIANLVATGFGNWTPPASRFCSKSTT